MASRYGLAHVNGRLACAAIASSVVSVFAGRAEAHGLDADQADVRLAGDTAYVVATPSVGVFAAFDDDKNGLLQVDEVGRHRPELLARFQAEFRVADQNGEPGEAFFSDVSTPHAFDGSEPLGSGHLRFTLRYRWPNPPATLRVQWHQAKAQPLAVMALRVRASKLLPEQTPLAAPERKTLTALEPGAFFLAVGATGAPTGSATEGSRVERSAPTAADEPGGASLGAILRVLLVAVLAVVIAVVVGKRRRSNDASGRG